MSLDAYGTKENNTNSTVHQNAQQIGNLMDKLVNFEKEEEQIHIQEETAFQFTKKCWWVQGKIFLIQTDSRVSHLSLYSQLIIV